MRINLKLLINCSAQSESVCMTALPGGGVSFPLSSPVCSSSNEIWAVALMMGA